jgi:hypothetical protein
MLDSLFALSLLSRQRVLVLVVFKTDVVDTDSDIGITLI